MHPTTPAPWALPVTDSHASSAFRAPAGRWGPGHRGIDLPAAVGERVRAVAPGTVVFAGLVGGVPTVSIDHGGLHSTYQPVQAQVHVGDVVDSGDAIGTISPGSGHCPTACLHLGAKTTSGYLDPAGLLAGRRIVLKPVSLTPLADAPG